MSRVEAAAAMDRLPWLPDDPAPQRARQRGGSLLPWAVGALAVAAGASFWLGTRTIDEQPPVSERHGPTTTVRLPEPRTNEPRQVRIAPQPQVDLAPQPQVRALRVNDVRIAVPAVERRPTQRDDRSGSSSTTEEPQHGAGRAKISPSATIIPAPAIAPRSPTLVTARPWNPRVTQGADGRVVQIGAFGSVHQAKAGWVYMVRAYPALSRLPAVVRPTRNSTGRIFYRFQVGTTSQAHSEVLCQRLQPIHFSCAVVDLPWKAKVER
jgi:hypothetical protein